MVIISGGMGDRSGACRRRRLSLRWHPHDETYLKLSVHTLVGIESMDITEDTNERFVLSSDPWMNVIGVATLLAGIVLAIMAYQIVTDPDSTLSDYPIVFIGIVLPIAGLFMSVHHERIEVDMTARQLTKRIIDLTGIVTVEVPLSTVSHVNIWPIRIESGKMADTAYRVVIGAPEGDVVLLEDAERPLVEKLAARFEATTDLKVDWSPG